MALELERELLNAVAAAGKGECARINAYMQKHFNDILSFLSRFLTTKMLSSYSLKPHAAATPPGIYIKKLYSHPSERLEKRD